VWGAQAEQRAGVENHVSGLLDTATTLILFIRFDGGGDRQANQCNDSRSRQYQMPMLDYESVG
jgi:hypothetical protein